MAGTSVSGINFPPYFPNLPLALNAISKCCYLFYCRRDILRALALK
jgi:hypothetical protein